MVLMIRSDVQEWSAVAFFASGCSGITTGSLPHRKCRTDVIIAARSACEMAELGCGEGLDYMSR